MRGLLIVGVVLAAAGAGIGAQDSLSAAKDLYASAAYEDALSTLGRMDKAAVRPEIARQIDMYRAFCLFALGRTGEAASIAESMVRKDPLRRLDAVDASPRLEKMFTDVRRRLLPSLIRERLLMAKSALEQKRFTVAEPLLSEARLMIVEAGTLGVKDDGLEDLSVLVDGFLALVRSAAEPQKSPEPRPSATSTAPPVSTGSSLSAEPPLPVAASASVSASPPPVAAPTSVSASPPPVAASASVSASPPPVAAPASVSASPPPVAAPASVSASPPLVAGPRVYSIDDQDVTPPVALEQQMPAMSTEMQTILKARSLSGVLDVVIDETGRVVEATFRQSLQANFDALIVRGALRWKYRPAMKDGVPVRYVKTVLLVP